MLNELNLYCILNKDIAFAPKTRCETRTSTKMKVKLGYSLHLKYTVFIYILRLDPNKFKLIRIHIM